MHQYAILSTHKGKENDMSGQHDLHNHQIAIKWSHYSWRKIEKKSAEHKMKVSEFIRWCVEEKISSVQLTAEDAQLIADRIKNAQQKGKMV